MIARTRPLKIAAIACTLLFWLAFFAMLGLGATASKDKPLDWSHLFLLAGGAVLSYVASFLIKRHLNKHGVHREDLKDLV